MLDSFDNDTLCSNNFGDSQGPQAMAFRRLSKRNSGTTVGPTFYHRRSRSHDQGTFYIHCRLEVIPAAGTVAWANSLIPSAETLDREATAPACISHITFRPSGREVGRVRTGVNMSPLAWCGIFLIRYECTARLR